MDIFTAHAIELTIETRLFIEKDTLPAKCSSEVDKEKWQTVNKKGF